MKQAAASQSGQSLKIVEKVGDAADNKRCHIARHQNDDDDGQDNQPEDEVPGFHLTISLVVVRTRRTMNSAGSVLAASS